MSAGELTAATAAIDDEYLYPSEDTEPVGETSHHYLTARVIFDMLEEFLAGRGHEVSLHANQFWYWQRGNPAATRAPDVMVIFGVPQAARDSYMSWQHGDVSPGVIIEVASQRQGPHLLRELRDLYERLGVSEYFVFDPRGLASDEPLTGFRLQSGRYHLIRRSGDGTMTSLQLGVRLRPDGGILRLVNPRTGDPLLTRAELAAKYKADAESKALRVSAISDQLAITTEELAAKEQELVAKDAAIAKLMDQLRQAGINTAPGGAP